MRTGRTTAAILMMSLMLIAIPSTTAEQIVDSTEDKMIDYTNEIIEIEINEDEGELKMILGDSRMHLEWGIEEDPGAISLFTSQSHYMGVADAYGNNGQFQKRVGIPVHTMFYQKLDGILEYEDVNNDGLFNVRGQGLAGTLDDMKGKNLQTEPIAKWVDFREVSWEMTSFSQNCSHNDCEIVFILESTDLQYSLADNDTDEQLELVRYIFRINTQEKTLDVEGIPHYKVKYQKDGDKKLKIDKSEQQGAQNVTANVLNSVWKYDQIINGWDADSNDSRLMTIVEYGMGAYMSDTVADWAKEQFGKLPGPKPFAGHAPSKKDLGPRGPQMDTHDKFGHPLKCGLDYVKNGGVEDNSSVKEQVKEYRDTHCSSDGDELDEEKVRNSSMVRAGGIHFDNNGARMGSIRWVSNATIDGMEEEVLFQIHGIRPVVRADLRNSSLPDGHYKGMRLIGGYNHPVGDNITHDPEYDVDVLTLDTMAFGEPLEMFADQRGRIQMLLKIAPILGGVIIIGVAGTIMVARRNAKKAAMIPKSAEFPALGQLTDRGTDWTQYENRKDV